MKKEYTKGDAWNAAALGGLVMAAVTIAAEFLSTLCGKIGGVAGGFLGFIAWAGKLIVCALLFKELMKRFHDSREGAGYPETQRFGLKLAFFSSLLAAAYSTVSLVLINPDALTKMIDTFQTTYSSMMDSNSMAALEKMLPKMPVYMAFGTFIYCFLWGWVYSTWFARGIAPSDPFAGNNEETQNL